MDNGPRPPPAPELRLPVLHNMTRNNQDFGPVVLHSQALYPLSHPTQPSGCETDSTVGADTRLGPREEIYLMDPGLVDRDLPCNVTRPPRQDDLFTRNGHDYYSKPVPLLFAPQLSSILSSIQDRPMDLLYFHFFINHTARGLMVHDCGDNPFRTILPRSKLWVVFFFSHWWHTVLLVCSSLGEIALCHH